MPYWRARAGAGPWRPRDGHGIHPRRLDEHVRLRKTDIGDLLFRTDADGFELKALLNRILQPRLDAQSAETCAPHPRSVVDSRLHEELIIVSNEAVITATGASCFPSASTVRVHGRFLGGEDDARTVEAFRSAVCR